ncbi:MAG: response regulator, partial [Pseudomonadota bacterium]
HVAHDFNNLLTIILGNAELLHDMFPQEDKIRRIAENIRTASLKGSELTRRLLSYARKQTLAPRPLDINQLVQGMRELLTRTLGVNISIKLRITTGLPPALVDEHQLEGALLNLSINARDAMPNGGELTISTTSVYIDEAEAGKHSDFRHGHYVRIRVADTGSGIAPEILNQVFEPFFTTKELGKGTGLGLSSVYGFAKQSNGHVTIESKTGFGTTVDLLLPVSPTPLVVIEPKPEVPRGGSETILVVDDDELVRSAVQAMLGSSLGYQVLAAASGETALTVLKGTTRVDLLFSDVMMPGMNGHELARQARVLRPELKVLLTSGYVSPTLARTAAVEGEFPMLPKPYSRQQLARVVRDILDMKV